MAIRVFPVSASGSPSFVDDFGVLGRTGKPHQGIDIFAGEGTPVLAVDDGQVRFALDPLGGNAFYLVAGDGTTYYGAHLSGYVGGAPRAVLAGDVLGYVGHTGNAQGTPSHLHFEVHPAGGAGAVDPYAELRAAVMIDVRRPPVAMAVALGAAAAAAIVFALERGALRFA
jgi:murein DD-endopeptidase MepM/ murein hydrolase activator NlpD